MPTLTRPDRPRLAALAAALALTGCATAGQPPPDPPTRPAELAFQVWELPGLLPPGAEATMPSLSLYGDGRLVLAGPPGLALPAPQERRLTAAGVRRVLAAARGAGLTGPTSYGQPRLADAPTVTFIAVTGGRRYVTRVAAPDADPGGDPARTRDERAARARLREFRRRLADLDGWLGGELAGGPAPYRFTRLAVLALPAAPDPAAPPARAWPLGPLATAGEPLAGGRCQVLEGRALTQAVAAAAGAVPATPWQSGGAAFHVRFRPLLPGERGCQALAIPPR